MAHPKNEEPTPAEEVEEESGDDVSEDGELHEDLPTSTTTPAKTSSEPSGSKKKSNKKKKKRDKAKGVISSLVSGKGKEVPQELVDHIVENVKHEPGIDPQEVNEEEVRKALKLLKVIDVLEGKSGLGGKNAKDMGEHKFWKTQPVPQLGEEITAENGPIEHNTPHDKIRKEPYPLPKDFYWSTIDIADPNQIKEVYDLLSLNYVEDNEASFRFQYSAEFFEWALKPPGYHKEWHIGVRAEPKKKLIAFISGVPLKLSVRDRVIDVAEINFLCVLKKLRSKRLAPVLIKEVTRQVHLKGLFQAIYTAGVVLPTPVSTCRYFHRSLNISKLIDVNFTFVPRNSTRARMIREHTLPSHASFENRGLREMEAKDVDQVTDLYRRYMERFEMRVIMSPEEILHNLTSGRGKGEIKDGRRERQVVWSYVVEDPETHRITDFFSFYSLPSTVINNKKHPILEVAYMFYYGSETAFEANADENGLMKKRLLALLGDALIIANRAKFDVFNAMSLMDNGYVLSELKFGQGDGYLNYYLYNWRTAPLEGYQPLPESQGGKGMGRGVGVVML